ncbi:ABC transporter ATP-binding protein [Alienimonas sp. DA493]|uniref:ABC transporter ATP-binding protein n=1 Tax=Alienimonas sp. DA493 TaxID=3373605 RepID=UPI0037552E54
MNEELNTSVTPRPRGASTFPPALEVCDVRKAFGPNKVLGGVNLTVPAGQIVSLVGPSGCGKSTLLRSILGTHSPDSGVVKAGGEPVCGPNRDVGIVYQHYTLYDFLTARGNVALGLKLDRTSLAFRLFQYPKWRRLRKEHCAEADDFLTRVGLGAAADLYPREMSGGMRQRVAVAQAFVLRPKVVLLDEPFGALDEATREELQLMLLRFAAENRRALEEGREPPFTILIVTHELNEALYVADRVIGLSQYHPDGANGAKIVYDEPAPHFAPDSPRDMARLVEQRETMRAAVFDPENRRRHAQLAEG